MDVAWAAVGAVAGWLAGAALRGTVFRLSVPAGSPDRTVCPGCIAPLPAQEAEAARLRRPAAGPRGRVVAGPRMQPAEPDSRLALARLAAVGRCAHCGCSLGPPAGLELTTGAVLALLFGRLGGQPITPAFGFLGAIGVALAAIDIRVQRLPDRLTLPAYPVLIALLAVAALAGHETAALMRALLGGLALGVGYLLLAAASRGQIGGGDIKLAGLVGLALGWLGWPALFIGAVLGFVLAAVASLGLLAARRVTLHSAISFGPFLLGGALLAILVVGGPAGPGFR